MSSVAGINEIKFQHIKSVDSKTSFGESPQAEEKKNSANKILIGAGAALAVTGTVIGGIMYAKKAKFTKALDKITDSLQHRIKVKKGDERYAERFDMSKVDEELTSVVANAKKTKNLDELNKMYREYGMLDCMFRDGSNFSLARILKESNTETAQALKKALEGKGDFTEVRRLYAAELKNVHQRYNIKHSPADGKNLQETIDLYTEKGMLPEGVKPHTYGADEMDLAVTNYTSGGGYTDYMLRKNHLSESGSIAIENDFCSYNIAPDRIKSKWLNNLVSSFKDSETGTDVVSLRLPDAGVDKGFSKGITYKIAAGNKSGKLTPLQKDLIEVGGRLNEDEVRAFAKLLDYQENMDYDAILSLIQHYAKDAEFMARPVK